eukprot:6488917-Amphidinium_carterae.3
MQECIPVFPLARTEELPLPQLQAPLDTRAILMLQGSTQRVGAVKTNLSQIGKAPERCAWTLVVELPVQSPPHAISKVQVTQRVPEQAEQRAVTAKQALLAKQRREVMQPFVKVCLTICLEAQTSTTVLDLSTLAVNHFHEVTAPGSEMPTMLHLLT